MGNDLCSENTKLHGNLFFQVEAFQFSKNFMKM